MRFFTAAFVGILCLGVDYTPAQALQCDEYYGWRRMLELHSAHWDVVNLITVGGPTTLAFDVRNIILCAAPLVYNEFGMESEAIEECDGWFDPENGCNGDLDSTFAGSDQVTPAWGRFPHGRRTRVWSSPSFPNLSKLAWVSNQHSSPILRPADVAIYVVSPHSSASDFSKHVSIQESETLHSFILFGDVCDKSSQLRKEAFDLLNWSPDWVVDVAYCDEDDLPDAGMLVLTRRIQLSPGSQLYTVDTDFAAPTAIDTKQLFVNGGQSKDGPVYAVPESCVFRLAGTPFQRVWRDEYGHIQTETHQRVPPQYDHQKLHRPVAVTRLPNLWNYHVFGHYCGVTVFTHVFAIEGMMLFYTVAAPLTGVLHDAGLDSITRIVPSKRVLPVFHTYFHYDFPRVRSRRYAAYQMEYAEGKVKSPSCLQYMKNGVVAWEYTQHQLQQWQDRGVGQATQMPLCYHGMVEYRLDGPPPAGVPLHSEHTDVLFPGIVSSKQRRREILKELEDAGVTTRFRSYLDKSTSTAAKYGAMDVYDARGSDAIINIHAYGESGDAQLEMPRLTPYLSNGVFVISERGVEPMLERRLQGMMEFVPHNDSRLSSKLVQRFIGAENAGYRHAVQRSAVAGMKSEFACENDPRVRESFRNLVHATLPRWYIKSFVTAEWLSEL